MKAKKIILFIVSFLLCVTSLACESEEYSEPEQMQEETADEQEETIEENEEMARTIGPGIYTFYNEETKSYLSYQDRRLVLSQTPQNWTLKSTGNDGLYVYAGDLELLLDIDNAYIAEGTTIKIWEHTGYLVQVWTINANSNGTYSFISVADNRYCLGFQNGNAVLQLRKNGNPMQEWKVVDVGDSIQKNYVSYTSNGGVIELQLPLDITKVISSTRLQQWANELEMAYYSFYELTNYMPYKQIVVEAYKPCEYTGYVLDGSNIIHIDNTFIYDDLAKMAVRNSDWNFCALHEMGHMFDSYRAWNFETEMLTDLKLAYVLEQNGVAAAPAEFSTSDYFYGKDIIKAYEILGSDISQTYDIYGCAYKFLQIKEDIGWEPFKQTFHYLQENNDKYVNLSKQEKFENFIYALSLYSGKDIKSYFSSNEWATIINKVNS